MMMTIVMYCDRCGEEIDPGINGGVRVRTGSLELALHLCAAHQKELRSLVKKFCEDAPPRDVKQPSLSGRADE